MTAAFSDRRIFETLASRTVRFLCQAHISARVHVVCPETTQEHPCQSPRERSGGISISLSASQFLHSASLWTQNVLRTAIPHYLFLGVPPFLFLHLPVFLLCCWAIIKLTAVCKKQCAQFFYTCCPSLTCKAMQSKHDLTSVCGFVPPKCLLFMSMWLSSTDCILSQPNSNLLKKTTGKKQRFCYCRSLRHCLVDNNFQVF